MQKYKGRWNTVFVELDNGLDVFFASTGIYRTFDFLFYSDSLNVSQPDLYDHFMRYQYINGHMSEQGGPATMDMQIK